MTSLEKKLVDYSKKSNKKTIRKLVKKRNYIEW